MRITPNRPKVPRRNLKSFPTRDHGPPVPPSSTHGLSPLALNSMIKKIAKVIDQLLFYLVDPLLSFPFHPVIHYIISINNLSKMGVGE